MYPLERFQKPRYVPRDSGRKIPEDAGRTVAKQRGACCEGGGCTPIGPATKSKISVTLSSPLGCEQGSHMWFSPCFGERHGCNFKTRLVIEKERRAFLHRVRTVSRTIYYRKSSTAVNDIDTSDSFNACMSGIKAEFSLVPCSMTDPSKKCTSQKYKNVNVLLIFI